MTTITFSKKLIKENEDLVAIPRKEYEEFLRLRLENIPAVKLTSIQKKHIDAARKNMAKGNYLTLDELKRIEQAMEAEKNGDYVPAEEITAYLNS